MCNNGYSYIKEYNMAILQYNKNAQRIYNAMFSFFQRNKNWSSTCLFLNFFKDNNKGRDKIFFLIRVGLN